MHLSSSQNYEDQNAKYSERLLGVENGITIWQYAYELYLGTEQTCPMISVSDQEAFLLQCQSSFGATCTFVRI